jgi:hypothetical protein
MPAYSNEIGGEIMQSPVTVQYAHFLGIASTHEIRGSTIFAASFRCVDPAQGVAAHTDPQILFPMVTR